MGNLLKKNNQSTLVFTGDGGASEGDFHEALNVAAVWDLPVIFVVENNQWGLSTPSNQQFACKQFIDKGVGYGMKALQIDGNNILEVYETIKKIRSKQQKDPKPYLVECITFRIRGHEEASGTKYYPEGLVDKWSKKDPVSNFERYLLDNEVISLNEVEELKKDITKTISDAFEEASLEPEIVPNTEEELNDMFKSYEQKVSTPSSDKKELRFIDAISDGLDQAKT